MSIEAKIDELIGTMTGLTTALNAVAANQERLLAGQAAAIDKVEAPKTTRRKKADETTEAQPEAEVTGNVEPAPTASGAVAAASASNEVVGPTDEQVKATAVAWVGTTEDVAEKQRRAQWLQDMIVGMGVPDDRPMKMLTGPEAKLTGEHRKKAVFFIKRAHKLGGTQHVDFSAPYDFDEAPDQDAPRVETPTAAEPAFDPLG